MEHTEKAYRSAKQREYIISVIRGYLDSTRYTFTSNWNNSYFRCYLAKEQCVDSTLHIITDQSCSDYGFTVAATAPPKSTTPSRPDVTTEPLFQNHDQLLDYFCYELMHEDCPQDTNNVCGSDNVTYDNV